MKPRFVMLLVAAAAIGTALVVTGTVTLPDAVPVGAEQDPRSPETIAHDRRAGAKWARDQNLTDPNACRGRSPAFIAGCQEYAADQQHAEIHSLGD